MENMFTHNLTISPRDSVNSYQLSANVIVNDGE